ncbi:MAG: polyhydroxybutyrate depolymerase [Polyangiaceae bacterium]|nr:polyhydroxybutyrate depolymerase [Polyangiaceae bacterium]
MPTSSPLFALPLALALLAGCSGKRALGSEPLGPGDHKLHLTVSGGDRSYLLHLPPSHDGERKLPLVIALHGGGGHAENMARMSGLSQKSDAEGFAVVYPNGTGRFEDKLLTWNAGNCCGLALDRGADDVGFIRSLLDTLAARLPLDPKRVYATGMSNGGMMAYRLGCELADRIAAIGPVAGALSAKPCNPSVPISLVVVHGMDDEHVLYAGGAPKKRVDPHPRVDASVAAATAFFVARNGCDKAPARAEHGRLTQEAYTGCQQGTEVRVYSIKGEGHTWPGGRKGGPWGDEPAGEISANDLLWDFFEKHPKP